LQKRFLIFFIWVLLLAAVFFVPLSRLVAASLQAGYSSHIVLIPFIAAYLVWAERLRIFVSRKYCLRGGIAMGVLGVIAGVSARLLAAPAAFGFLTVLSALLLLVAGFLALFGLEALRHSLFPMLLLVMVLPVPSVVVDKIIFLLQSGSARLSEAIFSLLGVPVLRNGFLLSLPGVTIEVAEECSGINSSIALFILTLLLAHETLKSNVRRAILVLLILPLSILKNAIRIVTLTLLATKVDPDFLTGRLHHQGGFVFFLITLAVAYPIWKLLRAGEQPTVSVPKTEAATGISVSH